MESVDLAKSQNASSCGQHIAAETHSFLNGLGHAEWIAAHFAEARFPNFDVAQRSIFLRHFQIQCIVDAKSLYDHLVSLSSPSNVEDKRCGFDLVISRQCMQRLGATIRWAPTNRQLADALTKDSADPVDLLRSCMRSGEYQLSPEHIILERAAAERSRRKQRQTSSQSSSLQSEPVVSTNAFMVQSGICLKPWRPGRSHPIREKSLGGVLEKLENGLCRRNADFAKATGKSLEEVEKRERFTEMTFLGDWLCSLTAMAPKVVGATGLTKFRPIAGLCAMRKVLGYVWLKSLPPLKYESVQTAFVPKTHAMLGCFCCCKPQSCRESGRGKLW